MLENYTPVHEKRLVNRLKNYWDNIKPENSVPEYNRFNKNFIADMWENCMLFYVINNGDQKLYHCEHVGSQLTISFGNELKDAYVSSRNKLLLPGANLMKYMDIALSKKDFIMSSGQFVNYKNKIVKYRDCILPFTDNNSNISYLIVGISWREFN
ncbi:MAG TPA: hypothetical protein DIV86_02900 [Alphaproteobacteria bacterium]|nr:hypothetical protein [Alphaproteobacteria bacterium]